MSVQDIQISDSRQNQGKAIKSKDWEQVRNKKFYEEDILWYQSQNNIYESKQQEKTSQNANTFKNQDPNSQRQNSENDFQQKQILNIKNSNSRRLQYFSKYHTNSRTRTIEIDIQNVQESSRINQASEIMTSRDQRSYSLDNQQQVEAKSHKPTISFENYKLIMITNLKLRLRSYFKSFTDTNGNRLQYLFSKPRNHVYSNNYAFHNNFL